MRLSPIRGTMVPAVRAPIRRAAALTGLAALIRSKAPGVDQWFKVNTNAISDVALARTKDNFDGGASIGISDTWADNDAVALGGSSGGIGSAGEMYDIATGYSKASIDRESGRVIHPTMGHTDTGDGSGFGIEPGATAWSRLWKGGRIVRYEDAGHSSRLPAWSHQALATVPGDGATAFQWITVTDADGNERPHTGHHYAGDFIDPETGVYYASMTAGYGNPATSAPGGVWKYDPATGLYTEHWYSADTTLYGTALSRDGFIRQNGGAYSAVVHDPITGRLLFFWNSFFIYEVSDPTGTPSVARKVINGANFTTYDPASCPEMVIIPDPLTPGEKAMFMHRADSHASAEFVLYHDLNTSDFTEVAYTYTNDPSAVFGRASSQYDSFDHNEVDKRIVVSQGDRKIYKIDYDGISDPADFQLVEMTSSPTGVGGSGDLPPTTQGQCRIRYLKDVSAELGMELYGMVTRGDYYIYRRA